jgi:predicted Fe-Mo cluster-binding NifX family protein
LSAGGIRVFTDVSGTIRDVVEKYKKGEFKVTKNPSVTDHYGIKAVGKGLGRGGNV